jgi:hypothetical protein
MYFQIKELVLWPRRAGLRPQRIKFALGKVNVITGASRTGKSAVTPIIDYCLGARACGIPVKTIRDACAWFGVVVSTPQGEKLFARREPGQHRATDEMYLLEAPVVEVPDQIALKNTNADQVRRMLDELCGLTNLDFSAGTEVSGFSGRPSFRDLGAFVFQPQNIIANKDILFYKADTHEHREKLRTIFPYILNAITPELLAKEHELRQLERELRRKDRELNETQQVSAQWIAEIQSKVAEARELGLIPSSAPAQMTQEEMLELLRGIVKKTDLTLHVSSSTISAALNELMSLEKEEAEVSRELGGLRRRLGEMKRLRESSSSYHEALQIQRDRLQVADWLSGQHTGDEECPVCGGSLEESGDKLKELVGALQELEKATGVTQEIPAAFDKEFQRVQTGARELSEKLNAVQIRRTALEQTSAEVRDRQFKASRASRFVGSLENALQIYERLGQDNKLVTEVNALRERVASLRREINASDVEGRKKRALAIVNATAGKLLPKLDVESPDDPVSLSIENLTVQVLGQQRADYLWEIGSGSNWLSYHLAIMLGLQQFFLSLKHSPVPGLLLFDQPSQVYFPKRLAERPSDADDDPQLSDDEDVEAVQKAFRVMAEVVTDSKERLQIIVLDHAAEAIWGGIPGVHLVDEWRNGRKLVPLEWLA